jgi:protein TonB
VAAVSPDWRAALLAWLRAHRVYPEEARRRGEEGEVDLRFAVSQDGAVTSVAITHSSGSDRLDAAALTMLRGAHVPAFPPDMKVIETVQTARIRYQLDE